MMSRKVFISFLGFSNYGTCHYTKIDRDFKSEEVRFIQEATLRYLMSISDWQSTDCAYILLTSGAEQRNWVDNGHTTRDTHKPIQQKGLRSCLENMHLPFPVVPVKNLPDGNNETEIWTIFEHVFDCIQEGDELYFDLTHGFRYLPMLVLVLGNYSKFLKNAVVKSITYGNSEARNKENEAPIIDLLSLSELQDWTSASASFLRNGNVSMLKQLCTNSLSPILKETEGKDPQAKVLNGYMNALEKVVDDLNTCRGVSILQGKNMNSFNKYSSQLKEVMITPMKPLIEQIKSSFENFRPSEDIMNGYFAAKWCLDHQLYQQSLTILHENIVSHICESEKLDIAEEEDREIINKGFSVINKRLENKKDKWKCTEEQKMRIEKLLNNEWLNALASTFLVTTTLRNDYNHAGMRENPMSRSRLITNLKERLDIIFQKLKEKGLCS